MNNISESTKRLIQAVAAAHVLRDAHPELHALLASGNASEQEVVPHLQQYLNSLHEQIRRGGSPEHVPNDVPKGGSTASRAMKMANQFEDAERASRTKPNSSNSRY